MKNKTLKKQAGILFILYLFIILFITKGNFIFGSNTDFIRQHTQIPEYFRNLFYETGEIIPKFALHLGAGENIFYYAYYGFLSPIVLFSYFFPFIDMTLYLMFASLILTFISVLLIYFLLKKNNYSLNLCFIGSLLFMFSSSLIFHSHRHIMFVNYFPFLLFAFFGVHNFLEKKKSFLLILNVFLMILTSFYFSIPGIISISLYALYTYLKINPHSSLKEIFIMSLKFILRIFLGILLASFFLIPVFYVIFNGRNSSILFDIFKFIPHSNLDNLMYGNYGIGLTSILWISFIYQLIYGRKENKVLIIFLAIFTLLPISNILLNGGLYTNGKCFIPFLPLYIILIINTFKNAKFLTKPIYLFILFCSIFLLKANLKIFLYFVGDILFSLVILYLYQKKKKEIILIPIIIISSIICLSVNSKDNLVSKLEYQKIKKINNYNYTEDLDQENSTYRFMNYYNGSNSLNFSKALNDLRVTSYSSTTNPYYSDAFYNSFNNNDIYRNKFMLNETNNLFFQKFMSVKYILSKKNPGFGYEIIKNFDDANLYKTDNVYPIGYARENILNRNEYNNLSWDKKMEALINNIIVDDKSIKPNNNFESKKINLEYEIIDFKNITYEKTSNGYFINSNKNGKLVLKILDSIVNDTLMIRFKLNRIPKCSEGDIAITINGITNKLTCESWKYYNENEIFNFVLSDNEAIDELNILFSKGIYDISSLEIYSIPNSFFSEYQDISPLTNILKYKNGNILEGLINNENNDYFIFSIPYDKGFQVLVDGKNTEYHLVNEAFIGFKLDKGIHKIELKFFPPGLKVGSLISCMSGIIIFIILIKERKK